MRGSQTRIGWQQLMALYYSYSLQDSLVASMRQPRWSADEHAITQAAHDYFGDIMYNSIALPLGHMLTFT